MQFLFGAFVCFLVSVTALPQSQKRSFGPPTVSLSYANVIGSSSTVVDSFKGIPYAQPPVGNLRLKPPQPITANLGTINAVGVPKACPQFLIGLNTSLLPLDVVGYVLNTPLLQTVTDSGEDCLTINVQRPSNLPAGTKLPVVFWIFGGGFEFGSTQIYDGSQFVLNSISKGTPVIFVSVNYRVGGFGFMPGKEILADGSSNLGLLDQRLGLQWVADNIAAFGGDPDKVTIWGESAGSISVLDQMVLYNGDNTYKGKPLFRGAIMDSGSVVPANPVDCAKGQVVYDTVVRNAGCSNSLDTLACLRSVSYETLLNASNSVPGIFSYNSLALSYLPRPDGKVLTDSPDTLILNGLYAKVPFIVGDQKDEGTLFALTQGNILTNAQLTEYLQTLYFPTAPASTISGLVNAYPDSIAEGSPFDTGILNSVYPKFKKLAAMLGDLTFTLTRRRFLSGTTALAPSVPSWSYLASYGAGFPILGTFHATDILPAFGFTLGFPQQSIQGYYIAFINSLNPNTGSKLTNWPQWSTAQQLMNFQALQNVVIQDNFRSAQYQFIVDHETDLFI